MQNITKVQRTDRHGEEEKKKKDQMELFKIHTHLDIKTLLNPTLMTNGTIHFSFKMSFIFVLKEICVQY